MAEGAKRVVVAYDGSECSKAAVRDLARAGLGRDAEIVVLSVAEMWLPPGPVETWARTAYGAAAAAFLGEAERLAEAGRALAAETLPGRAIRAEVRGGSAAGAIEEFAAEWPADLVAIGSHGRGAVGRLAFGSVSHAVAANAPCSVRVVRRPEGTLADPPLLVVAYDASPGSDAAVAEIARRAWPAGTRVLLVTAVGPHAAFGDDLASALSDAERAQTSAAETLADAGLSVETYAAAGDPRHAVVDSAADCAADAIFVGTRDLNRRGRFLLGSVSLAIVGRAHCPVEVVRA